MKTPVTHKGGFHGRPLRDRRMGGQEVQRKGGKYIILAFFLQVTQEVSYSTANGEFKKHMMHQWWAGGWRLHIAQTHREAKLHHVEERFNHRAAVSCVLWASVSHWHLNMQKKAAQSRILQAGKLISAVRHLIHTVSQVCDKGPRHDSQFSVLSSLFASVQMETQFCYAGISGAAWLTAGLRVCHTFRTSSQTQSTVLWCRTTAV